ncbi:MAG: hypothetical protein H7A45_17590 [Verrucomicrobiales bacterium]|nr:hypothetical protein [Verrucomicrobiales bacterium]
MQAPIWTVPYLSGAANYSLGAGWRVSPKDVDLFKRLPTKERWSHRFSKTERGLVQYGAHDVGFVYVCLVARTIFPFLGDLRAIQVLNWMVHLACCAGILLLLDRSHHRWLFIVLYAANPVIVYLATFPYYYFWQILPSFALAWLVLRPGRVTWGAGIIALFLMAAGVAIRPSTLPVVLLTVAYLLLHKRNAVTLACAVATVVVILLIPKANKMFFFTAYVGLGAYPNPENLSLSDESGYARYKQTRGTELEFDFGGNYYDSATRRDLNGVLKHAFLDFAREHPVLLLRNAFLNTGLAFGGGYFVGLPYLALAVCAVAGWGFAILLWIYGRKVWVLATLSSVAGFVAYYPPVPVYMLGGYVFVVLALLSVGGRLRSCRPLPSMHPASVAYEGAGKPSDE